MKHALEHEYLNYHYTDEDRHTLLQYKALIDAMGALFGETCEIVLHSFEDLNASVIHIHNGALTGRTIGSPVTDKALQILYEQEKSNINHTEVYLTKNKNNHTMRSISTIIKNSKNHPIGMLCINLDISVPLDKLLTSLMPLEAIPKSCNDGENFAIDVDDLIESQTLKVKEQIFADNTIPLRHKIKEIVFILNEQGIFKLREAVNKVAKILDVSRDVVYMHLRQLKKYEQQEHDK